MTRPALKNSWIYSPAPAVEKELLRLRNKYESRFPENLDSMHAFLAALGDPHLKLPFVFHVAGTNGKGSTLAFLQAIFEAGGKTVHKFIGPHLVRFEERIILSGKMIEEQNFLRLIHICEEAAKKCAFVSFFEFFTGLALLAFSQTPADAVLLETGLGGTRDSTNVINKNLVSLITRISRDHVQILGPTLKDIAAHKAGIMKKDCPVILAPQEEDITALLLLQAQKTDSQALLYSRDWEIEARGDLFLYTSAKNQFTLPRPGLQGAHQMINAGSAIAAIEQSPFTELLQDHILMKAMHDVIWPGRLQKITSGPLAALLPQEWELWIDGAHNDSGADALVIQAKEWGKDKPLHLITTCKKSKDVNAFYQRLAPMADSIQAIDIVTDTPMISAPELARHLSQIGIKNVTRAEDLESAIRALSFQFHTPQRILVTGSLYLMGYVLRISE